MASANEQDSSVITDKAIHLYNSLKAAIDKSVINPEAIQIPLPPSPSNSSSSVESNKLRNDEDDDDDDNDDDDCPCQHILGENELIATCSLCQSPIPIIEELLAEKASYEDEILELQVQLEVEQKRISEQLTCIDQLNSRLEQVVSELNTKTTEFEALRSDMELLNDKYVDEIERVAEIQHSKDMVESELEDLSRRLFEEANGMVAHEKREKHNLEIAQRHLENQLKETRERLGAEQMQLKELRKRMEDMALECEQSANETASITESLLSQAEASLSNLSVSDQTQDATHLFDERTRMLSEDQKRANAIDAMVLGEFEEFVKTGTSVPLKKLHTIPFMKYCQEEDVEACLRFGSNSRLSARKINEAIVLNTCFIEESPPGFAKEQAKRIMSEMPLKISGAKSMMWERFSSNHLTTVFSGCQACGRNDGTALPYRFRISYFDDWACIDRFCRDRLVAVCEFYVLIRNIRQGLYSNRTISDLYQEAIRLRLQMFYARMGALPWTLRTPTAISKKQIKVISSESSPLPKSIKTIQDARRGSLNEIVHTKKTNLAYASTISKEDKESEN
ncbi:hypothetical protein BD560DRAFT_370826 [Blakeslea trispora]|nr:hypothetical protein BD560DRAFT_370826 [Blakeslea trispora]